MIAAEALVLRMIKRLRMPKAQQIMVVLQIKILEIKKLEQVEDQVHHLAQVQVSQVMVKRNLIMDLKIWIKKLKKKAQDHHLALQVQVLGVKQTKRKKSLLPRSQLNLRKLQLQLHPKKRGRSQIHQVVLVVLHRVQILMDQAPQAHLVHLQAVKSAEWKSARKTLLVLVLNVQMKKVMNHFF